MSERKWMEIIIDYDDGTSARIRRANFDQMEEIQPVLDALLHAKRMQKDLNRLLGEVGD